MPTLDDDRTGARIKEQRKLARLSQRELAARIPYSYSLLNQVECGARPATDAFVAAVAAALGIDIAHLQGPTHVTDMQQGRLAALMSPTARHSTCTTSTMSRSRVCQWPRSQPTPIGSANRSGPRTSARPLAAFPRSSPA